MNITITDLILILATLAGPILAVQAQKWIERGREATTRRTTIFRTLMVTRLANLSLAHVEALNAIPLEFYGARGGNKDVMDAWKQYIDHLNRENAEPAEWGRRRYELFTELLWKLAQVMGFSFTKLELQREVYSPRGHAQVEAEQDVIRQGLSRLFRGEGTLPLDIKSFPVDPEALKAQVELNRRLAEWLEGQSEVRVKITES